MTVTCFCSIIRNAIFAKGGTETAFEIIGKPEGAALINKIADMLIMVKPKTRDVYPVTIDYSRTLEQMIAACACEYVNPNITSANFPFYGTGIVQQDITLLDFDYGIDSYKVLGEMVALGLEPARIEHSTAFGEKYPDMQRVRPIIFLDSVWRGRVPCLGRWRGGREFCLLARRGRWGRNCQFAAVPKNIDASIL